MGRHSATAVMVTFSVLRLCSTCSYGSSPPMAIVGQKLVLECSITCPSQTYEWFNVTGGERIEVDGVTKRVMVSEDVTSVAEVGGQMYECHCAGICEMFKIGVKPIPKLYTSVPVARLGSSVNVTCVAESYPPANTVGNYLMRHPRDKDVDRVLLPGKNGVVHIISGASGNDSGEYECTVTVKLDEYSTPLQSDNVNASLVVYDPPTILSVKNFTLSEVTQSAILECNVSNTENDLNVWVNWTTSSGDRNIKDRVRFREGNVFYLLLHNASVGDYTCQLYSTYSPLDPEDVKNGSVLMKECPPTKGGVTERGDHGTSALTVALVCLSILTLLLVMSVIGLVAGLVCLWRKHSTPKSSSSLPSQPGVHMTDVLKMGESTATTTTSTSDVESLRPQVSVHKSFKNENTKSPQEGEPPQGQDCALISEQNKHTDILQTVDSVVSVETEQKVLVSSSLSESQPQPQSHLSESRPSETFERQSSISESSPRDPEQVECESKSVKDDGVSLQPDTSQQEENQQAGKSGEIPDLQVSSSSHSLARFFTRSQSLYPGSPPKAPLTSYEHSSQARRLSDLPRRPSLSRRNKNQEEKESLLPEKGKDPKFTVGGSEEEQHSDEDKF